MRNSRRKKNKYKSLHLSTAMKQTLRGPLQTADALNGLYYLKNALTFFFVEDRQCPLENTARRVQF